MAVSLEQFSRQLADSGALSEQDLREFLDKLPATEKPVDGEQLAKRLVKEKKISAYQAQVVYSGKGKSLTMGSYTVLDKLGQGGMGMVLKAEHRMMMRLVAIKVLAPTITKTKELAQRFHREVQAAARLTHPNIVGAFDAGETNGSPFLVMEYVPGDDLSSIVKKKGPLSVDQAIDCIAQAAKGLEFAQSQGVIHRDIKPANLLMDTKGVVKILDMGLARIEATDVATQADLTGTGAVMGTVDYMAPEQALSTKHADARSDLYSLGISLWYLLTGKSAYEGDSLMARMLAHRDQPIPSLRAGRGEVPESLDHVFRKLVAKKQADRYQTATELLVDLQACRTRASIKAVTVAEVATGPDEFQNFLQHIESPTQGPPGSRSNASMTGTKTLARSQASVTSADETLSPVPVSETQHFRRPRSRKAKSPPWFQDKRVLIGGGAAAVLLLMAVVFLFQTPNGTLRVEILDPEVEMRVKGSELTFRGPDLEPVSLKAGEKKLLVTRGDLSFETDAFTLKKGTESRVKVELLGDKLVVNSGGKVIAEHPIKRKGITTSTAGKTAPASSGNLFMHDPAFRQWMKDVQAMSAERQVEAIRKKLVELNPKFDGKLGMNRAGHGEPKIEDGKVTEFGFLTNEVADISPVSALRDLTKLHCGCSGFEMKDTPLKDVSPLHGLRLKSLDLFHNTSLSDLTALKGMPLATLTLSDANAVTTLAPLEGMMLTYLDLAGVPVKDLTVLKGMPLTTLLLQGRSVEDLTPLQGMPLKVVGLRDTQVADLSPLENMELTRLDINGCARISNVLPLRAMKLEFLACIGTKIPDHSFLAGMPLKIIELNFKPERDTEVLRSIKTLEYINLKPVAEFWKEVDGK